MNKRLRKIKDNLINENCEIETRIDVIKKSIHEMV